METTKSFVWRTDLKGKLTPLTNINSAVDFQDKPDKQSETFVAEEVCEFADVHKSDATKVPNKVYYAKMHGYVNVTQAKGDLFSCETLYTD